MDALIYEYLVRMAYNSGRNYGNGGDADIYRKLEREFYSWQKAGEGSKEKEDKEYEYRMSAAKVRTHVLDAIEKAQTQINDTVDTEQLNNLKSRLHMEEYDKQVFDEAIEEAGAIFRRNNLQAR